MYLRKRNNHVFYLLRKKRKRQIRVFLSPKKKKGYKICPSCPSCVSTVFDSYPNLLTYYLVNDTPHGVSDTYPMRVRCMSTCPRVRYTNTPQGNLIRAPNVTIFKNCFFFFKKKREKNKEQENGEHVFVLLKKKTTEIKTNTKFREKKF